MLGRSVLLDRSLYISSPLDVEDASKMEKWYGMAKRYWILIFLFFFIRALWYQVYVFHDFTLASPRHASEQDGAKEEDI